MLFDYEIEPCCSYCKHGTDLGRYEIACIKRGIMHGSGCCGAFRYEPTKRVPPALQRLNSSELTDEDFAL